MSSKPKDHTKTIATMKSVITDLKKSVNKITKGKEKEEAADREVSPEEHQAALKHFASQYKIAKVNKDDSAAADHARAYHDYAKKLSLIYQRKVKESADICSLCKVDPCICDESHGFINEKTQDEWVRTGKVATHSSGQKTFEWAKVNKEGKRTGERHYRTADGKYMGEELMNPYKNYVIEGKMGEKAAGDLDFHPEIKQSEPPFDGPYKKRPKVIVDKSGAKHSAMSRVRDLARRSFKKEEVEQVDELNVMTLSKYAAKARAASMDKDNPKRYKRGSGAAKAYDKIHRGEYSEGHVPDHSGVLNKSDAGTMSKVAALMAKERHGKSVAKKPAGEYDRKVTSYLKKKYQKEEVVLDEAVTVDKKKYSWGKMVTVHHGKDTSYPLHPEHQAAIKKLRSGDKTSFKDETGRTVHAHREGDQVHLVTHGASSNKTTVGYHHFDEGTDICNVCGQTPCNCTHINEIKMSDDEYNKNVETYGKRATNLLKHSWAQHDISKEKAKAGDKPGAEKSSAAGSKAHKLFLKAKERHLKNPVNAERHRKQVMSGISDYYKSKKPGEYTGD